MSTAMAATMAAAQVATANTMGAAAGLRGQRRGQHTGWRQRAAAREAVGRQLGRQQRLACDGRCERGRTGRRPPPGSSAATGFETGAQGPRRAAPCRSSPKGLSSRQTLLFRAYDGYKLPDEQRFERRLGTATGSPCPRSIACVVCCSSAAVGSARGRSHVLCRCCGYLLGRLLATCPTL